MTLEVARIGKVDKPERPPHVILLADVMGRLAGHPKLDALVVCYAIAETDSEPASIGSASYGSDASISFLLQRHLTRIVTGAMQRGPVPSDK